MKWLARESKLTATQTILDYGCGKGKDVEWLKSFYYNIVGYDPHYAPETWMWSESFDVVTCNFVMNVIEGSIERDSTILHIKGLLKPGGTAYVSVRADKAKLNGFTKRGTFQTYVDMTPYGFKLLHKGSGYELYEYVKPY